MKIKPILMFAIILVIGFVIGFLVSGQITRRKHKAFIEQRTHEGYKKRFYYMLELDQEQMKKIDPVLDKYADNNQLLVRSFREKLGAQRDSLKDEIKAFLTDEQLEKLQSLRPRRNGVRPGKSNEKHRQNRDEKKRK